MAAHYDAAGGGLDRFQPILTPESYPGNHYDSALGIDLSPEDKEGFSDRFWGRAVDSRDSLGSAGNPGAFPAGTHSNVQSPICPRCKLPRVEAQVGRAEGSPHLLAIDGEYYSCCCPDIRMPDEAAMVGHQFLRRHSSLWEKGRLSPGLDVVYEDDTNTGTIRTPVEHPFDAKNMPSSGQSIVLLERQAGVEDEEIRAVKRTWAQPSL